MPMETTTPNNPFIETELVRTRDGGRVHHHACRHNRWNNAAPWEWAQGRTLHEVWLACMRYGIKPCKVCAPFYGSGDRVIGQEARP